MPTVTTTGPEPDPPDPDRIEQLVDRHRTLGLEPGLAYGIVHDGRLVHAGGRGYRRQATPGTGVSGASGASGTSGGWEGDVPGPGTVFRIASMTKSFTAATVLLLRDEGLLRLDDEVTRYVPEVASVRPPTDDAPALTLRSLLTMTAGFPTDDPWGDRQQDLPDGDFARLLVSGLSFAWTPGVAFEYSNLGYALLGRVITAAAGEPYADVVRRRLLEPLGMTSTGFTEAVAPEGPGGRPDLATGHRWGPYGWEVEPLAAYGAFAPMGGLFSTVTDLARWVGGLSGAFPPRDGEAPGEHPLRRASRREMQLPHLGLAPLVAWTSVSAPPTVRGAAYGFGLVVERDPTVGTLVCHSGGYPGFGSHMRWHPASGLGVVVLGNATYTPAVRLGASIMDALLTGWRPPPGSTGPLAAPAACLATSSGSTADATAVARRQVEQLIVRWDDVLAHRLFSANVDLDEPLTRRRAKVEALRTTLGPLAPDDDAPVMSASPAHVSWWMRGPRGRLRVEIRLSPELPPRVQSLLLVPVPDPEGAHRRAAAQVIARLGHDDPRWPADLPLRLPLDEVEATRRLRAASAWTGTASLGDVVASDGEREATYRVRGVRADLLLTLTTDPRAEAPAQAAAVEDIVFVPAP
ncbi:MAG: Penicillin-binding protein [Actinomycetota bacterium]|nr:Penicillin-binding protein [Actinomycetota bacterium]